MINVTQRFGKLTVIGTAPNKNNKTMWACQCDCGNIAVFSEDDLVKGKVTSCGCSPNYVRFNDLTGKRFGKLVVISREPNDKYGRTMWKCQCDCGNESVVLGKRLTRGETKSCGCLRKETNPTHLVGKASHRRIDLTGNIYGELTVLGYAETIKSCAYWKCQCSCGNIVKVRGDHLRHGKTKSCGCMVSNYVSDNRHVSLVGQRFGKLLVVSKLSVKYFNDYVYHCRCDCGNEIDVIATNLRSGNTQSCGCTHIARVGSKDENAIKDYIGLDCVKDREVLGGKEIDLYYQEFGIGIEFNGSAYHANKNGVYNDLPKMYHRDKFLEAKEKGVHLISIFDVDWWNNQDKIKMYLDSIFKPKKSIYARKCEIKSITKELADEFTDKYHLQGRAKLNVINYGIYYNNELLAVMSFGKYRLKKNIAGHYELHRYCVKDSITVVGGANKLLKAFEREYNPKELLSFSDNDYFSGGIYERLGFNNDGQATPRYYWFLNGVEIKREQCQLKKLKMLYGDLLQEAYDVGASNKEDYVMLKLGARKVYRCGNTRWIKKY